MVPLAAAFFKMLHDGNVDGRGFLMVRISKRWIVDSACATEC